MNPDDDRRARYEALVRAVVEPLRRYALRRTDHASAEDAVADALLVMWRRLDDVPAGGELPWCYAVTRGCLANVQRSSRRQARLAERVARLDPPTEDQVQQPSPDPELDRALQELRPDERELLRLWAWEDLRPQEIAVVLGITPNAVSIRLHRAKSHLADALSRDAAGPTASADTGRRVAGKGFRRAGQMALDDTVPVDETGDSP